MFDDSNSYNLRTVISDGVTLYYVSFMDSQGSRRETEVSRPVYLEFLRFVKTERNLRRWNERHAERFDLAENALSERALYPQANIEDAAIDRFRIESIRQALKKLPEIQRRRFVLYHEFGFTYKQISEMEGCSHMSVKRAVDRAKTAIREKVKALAL